jgi:hypothetical protein
VRVVSGYAEFSHGLPDRDASQQQLYLFALLAIQSSTEHTSSLLHPATYDRIPRMAAIAWTYDWYVYDRAIHSDRG